MPRKRKLTVVDLFCGCGGLSLGLSQAALSHGLDLDIVLAIDANKAATSIYEANFAPKAGRVKTIPIQDIFDAELDSALTNRELYLRGRSIEIDFLVAGPPCQGNSDLNNKTRRDDPRNHLYLYCLRATRVYMPKVVLIENVPTVVHSKQHVVQKTREYLRKNGYFVSEFEANFLKMGVPQSRKRHILLACQNEKLLQKLVEADLGYSESTTLGDSIYDLQNEVDLEDLMLRPGRLSQDNIARVEYLFEKGLYELPDELRPPCHRDKAHSYKSIYGRLRWDQPAQTLTSGFGSMGQGRYIHPSKKRTITPREAARIQGFPDSFRFDAITKITILREILANAVPPALTKGVASKYLTEVFDVG
ncbi:MAG: DNA (cytosine-5-)-methyltransferase [Candidatus Latescibacteria bacterium]|nr:DNA (cytosine-5-)-methyltransferase [Candidatus Latescibacterota bacterium]